MTPFCKSRSELVTSDWQIFLVSGKGKDFQKKCAPSPNYSDLLCGLFVFFLFLFSGAMGSNDKVLKIKDV